MLYSYSHALMRYPTKFLWQCNLFFKQFFLKETRCWCCIRFFFPHAVSRPPQRGKGESVRREGSSNPKPPTYLSRHAKFTPASLAKEARETVKSVKTLIEEEREYYNTVWKQISGACVELPRWWRGRGLGEKNRSRAPVIPLSIQTRDTHALITETTNDFNVTTYFYELIS